MKKINLKANNDINGIISRPNNIILYQKYLHEMSKYSILTREEEHMLFDNIKNKNCQKSLDSLCKHNLRFVVSIAKTYAHVITGTVMTLEDLICEGNIGLINAIHKFDNTTDNKFISYAVWHIRQMIFKYINEHSKSIRTPQNVRTLMNKINRHKLKLSQILEREPDNTELYEYCSKNMKIVDKLPDYNNFKHIMQNELRDKLLSENISNDSDSTIADNIICDESDNTLNNIYNNENKIIIYDILKKLNNRDRDILSMFYGIKCEKSTLEQIGKKYNLTSESIRLKINKLIRNLKYTNKDNNPYIYQNSKDKLIYDYKLKYKETKNKIYDESNTVYLI